MALHLTIPIGGGIRIGDAVIYVHAKQGKNFSLQIDADKDKYPVDMINPSGVKKIWDGPPIFALKDQK